MKWSRLILVVASITCASGCGTAAVTGAANKGAVAPPPAAGPRLVSEEDEGPLGPDGPITPALRESTLDAILKQLNDNYVFPDKAAAVAKAIGARRQRHEYDSISTGQAFAKTLTGHINEVLKDAHFRIRFSLEPLPVRVQADKPSPEEIAENERIEKIVNGGFEKVERLPGNIGYLEVRSFGFAKRGYEAAAAAMNFLAETDALIIDIRRNGGGDPDMVASLCSYFFAEPVHLNDLYFRPKNETRQFWTSAGVPAKRYTDKEVYVLTSKRTGSGAEEFAYNLQQLKRATILGEVTWGGAHPGDVVRLNDHFSAFVPNGRAINPVSKTNWEGTGVKPDIETKAEDALRIAQIKILDKRIAAMKDPEMKRALEDRRRELDAPK